MTISTPDSDATSRWPPAFHGSIWLPITFVVAFSGWVLLSNVLFNWLAGSDPSTTAEALWNLPSGIVQLGLVLLVLRFENVRLRDLGVGRRQISVALIAVAGFLIIVNVVVAGRIVLGGSQLSIEPFALYRSPPLDYSVAALVATGVAQYVFVGPIEELAFRGYLQNKLSDLPGRGSTRFRTAGAIVMTAVIFSALHIPTLVLVDGIPISQSLGTLILLTLSGVTFGTIYALTHNLILVALLHGIGNFWPLIVNPGLESWPNWGIVIVLYGLLIVLYRYWTPVEFRSVERV
jgi:membrane protease YdiL (CAAX protease family)